MGWRDDDHRRQYAACDAWLARKADELLEDDRDEAVMDQQASSARLGVALANVSIRKRRQTYYSEEEIARLDRGEQLNWQREQAGDQLPHPFEGQEAMPEVLAAAKPLDDDDQHPINRKPSRASNRDEQAAPLLDIPDEEQPEHDDER